MSQKPQFSAGGRYRTRTCDLLGVNGDGPRQSAVFSPTADGVSPLSARYVPFAFGAVVHRGTSEPLGNLPSLPAWEAVA